MYDLSTEEGPERLNILLSRRALAQLDLLKNASGFGSRGRTVEEAILTVYDLGATYRTILDLVNKAAERGQPTSSETWLIVVAELMAKLGRFNYAVIDRMAEKREIARH